MILHSVEITRENGIPSLKIEISCSCDTCKDTPLDISYEAANADVAMLLTRIEGVLAEPVVTPHECRLCMFEKYTFSHEPCTGCVKNPFMDSQTDLWEPKITFRPTVMGEFSDHVKKQGEPL